MPMDTPKAFMAFWEASRTDQFGYDPTLANAPPRMPETARVVEDLSGRRAATVK